MSICLAGWIGCRGVRLDAAHGRDSARARRASSRAKSPAPAANRPRPATRMRITAPTTPKDKSINLLELTLAGGIFMIPIFAMSLLAGTMSDRAVPGVAAADRVLPDGLVTGLGQLAGPQGSFDPRKAYRTVPAVSRRPRPTSSGRCCCKVGRPVSEIESAVHAGQPARGRQAVCQRPLAQHLGVAVHDARPDRHDPGDDPGLSPADDHGRRRRSHAACWPAASIRPWSRRLPACRSRFRALFASHYLRRPHPRRLPPDRRAGLQPAAATRAVRRPRPVQPAATEGTASSADEAAIARQAGAT